MDLSEPKIFTFNLDFTRLSDPAVRLPGTVTAVYGDESMAIGLSCEGASCSGSGAGVFEALADARRGLETHDLCPVCYGASEDCHPSPAALALGYSDRVLKLKLGRKADPRDQVMIFDTGADIRPSSVERQVRYYRIWQESLLQPS